MSYTHQESQAAKTFAQQLSAAPTSLQLLPTGGTMIAMTDVDRSRPQVSEAASLGVWVDGYIKA